jgi:HEPN domain-containing protein
LSRDIAAILWIKALHDYNAANKLLSIDPEIVGDQVFGLLLQQSVEKAIKSTLLEKGQKYLHVHDLSLLIDTLSEKIAIPPGFGRLQDLTMYAVTEDESPLSPHRVDRQELLGIVKSFLELLEGTR